MIGLQEVTVSRGHKVLLRGACVNLYEGQKVGLVGLNGCGKSTLFSLILGELTTDAGHCAINPKLRISHLSQELPECTSSAIDFVLSGDSDYVALQQRLLKAEQTGDGAETLHCHELLTQTNGYSKPALAGKILSGLGFSAQAQQQVVNSFSGGWRMRLSLARCLMKPADLFLLDEPTNHLDIEAIVWLEKWLRQSVPTSIIISHDRDFLDQVVTHILHIEQQNTYLYRGNYTAFEQLRAEKFILQQAAYEKQQRKITHMMSFVTRFGAKSGKAQQAQSRLKAIAKMETVMQAQGDASFSFEFYPCPKVGKPLLQCERLDVGYCSEKPVLSQVNLTLNPGDRIALLGPNGEGKSTLIKTLTAALTPLAGRMTQSPHVRVGYFSQHQLDELDPSLSPIETLQALTPEVKEQVIRDYLGGFHFVGDMASQSMQNFSGGEKARLALAKLVWLKPNLLLLDEPTNHLDLTMRAAIEIALQSYEGALVLISHDRHLLRTTVDDLYIVFQKKLRHFDGDLDQYQEWLQANIQEKPESNLIKTTRYREKKQLQNRLNKLDQQLIIYQQEIDACDTELANPELYGTTPSDQVTKWMKERDRLVNKMQQVEAEWLEIASKLEVFDDAS